MIVNSENAKRCAVFVFYDSDGIVDEYNYYFLEELQKEVTRLIIICNGEVQPEGLERFRSMTPEVIVRPNEGFDITAYKVGLEHITYEGLQEYDEVMVLNSTNFGPFYPFSEMFREMDKKDIDFWGITNFHEVPFDPFGTISYGYIPKHIQSYFMVFRREFCATNDFVNYWKKLPKITSYYEAIGYHEAIFTKTFADKGYRWDVYVNSDALEGFTYDPLRDFPRYLIEQKRCPIMKRRSFFHDYGEALSRSGGEATREALDFVKEHTAYDVSMIWDNLLRLQNQADLKKRMHLNYVLSSSLPKKTDLDTRLKVALVLHIYYEELAGYCCKYASNMPEYVDIYVTAPNEEKMSHVKKVFAKLQGHKVEFRIVGNIGRDVAPFLVGCKDLIDKYDLICKLHDKKVYQVVPMSVGASWSYKCFENMAKNEVFIENVIKTFQENPKLGLLTPPVPNHAPYYPTTGKVEWGDNFDVAQELAKTLGINVDMTKEKEPVAPLGSMFWARTKALKVLFDHDWQYDEFPPEPIETDATVLHAIERIYPFCVQHEGYYPGWVMVDTFARIEMTNWNFINEGLETALFDKVGVTNFQELLNRTRQL